MSKRHNTELFKNNKRGVGELKAITCAKYDSHDIALPKYRGVIRCIFYCILFFVTSASCTNLSSSQLEKMESIAVSKILRENVPSSLKFISGTSHITLANTEKMGSQRDLIILQDVSSSIRSNRVEKISIEQIERILKYASSGHIARIILLPLGTNSRGSQHVCIYNPLATNRTKPTRGRRETAREYSAKLRKWRSHQPDYELVVKENRLRLEKFKQEVNSFIGRLNTTHDGTSEVCGTLNFGLQIAEERASSGAIILAITDAASYEDELCKLFLPSNVELYLINREKGSGSFSRYRPFKFSTVDAALDKIEEENLYSP